MSGDNKNKQIAENLAKSFLKNAYVFHLLLLRDDDMIRALDYLLRKYSEHDIGWLAENNDRPKTLYSTFLKRDSLVNKSIQEMLKWKPIKIKKFNDDVNIILDIFHLGKEWRETFYTLVTHGILCPPALNLFVDNDRKKEKGRVILELNPDTSLEDVEAAWRLIKLQQNKLWPRFRKLNYSKKMWNSLVIFGQDLEERLNKNADLDVAIYKKIRKNDLDIVGKIWGNEKDISEKADRKRRSLLRQIRLRLKKRDNF